MNRLSAHAPQPVRRGDDAGFGLVEILVSIFLLALLTLAFLPLLIDAMRVAVRNGMTATATQFASEQLDAVVQLPRTCAALQQFQSFSAPSGSSRTTTDKRGTVYTATRTVAACPSTFPAQVSVTVSVDWVPDSGSTGVVTSKTTAIVERAS
jgi:type II secretory pathway pseudopilin PulG